MIKRLNTTALIAGPIAALAALLALAVSAGQQDLGSYTTSLAGRSPEQRHNIELAARALDGVVIRPRKAFSFNKAVGPRVSNRGYVPAPAIVQRELQASPGGGVCQVSSTLYNAALLAGLEIVERHPHSCPVSSVPPGRDATVVFGARDLKFGNTLPEPVTIRMRVTGSRLVARITGAKSASTEVHVVVETADRVGSVAVGEETRRMKYCTATVWREELQDGQVIRSELVSSDTYTSASQG